MRLAAALALGLCTAAAPGRLDYLGVNLSGAEFGVPDEFRRPYPPGVPGTDYIFPSQAEIDGYAAAGFNVIRLPFAWERLQPAQNGPLDPAYLAGLDAVVRAAAAKRVTTVLEPANLGYGYGGLIGGATPDTAFADLWRRVAAHYAGQPLVMFGLMNEPHDQTAESWRGSAQAAIEAIRRTGAQQEVLVPGTAYSAGATWLSRGNATALAERITDPARNIAFEIHQYNDADMSGRSATPVSATIGADRLAAVTAWAEAGHHRLFLAEFGAGADADSLEAMRNQLAHVAAHPVWQGAAIWGGGPWWPPGYPLAVGRAQLDALAAFKPAPAPAGPGQPHGR